MYQKINEVEAALISLNKGNLDLTKENLETFFTVLKGKKGIAVIDAEATITGFTDLAKIWPKNSDSYGYLKGFLTSYLSTLGEKLENKDTPSNTSDTSFWFENIELHRRAIALLRSFSIFIGDHVKECARYIRRIEDRFAEYKESVHYYNYSLFLARKYKFRIDEVESIKIASVEANLIEERLGEEAEHIISTQLHRLNRDRDGFFALLETIETAGDILHSNKELTQARKCYTKAIDALASIEFAEDKIEEINARLSAKRIATQFDNQDIPANPLHTKNDLYRQRLSSIRHGSHSLDLYDSIKTMNECLVEFIRSIVCDVTNRLGPILQIVGRDNPKPVKYSIFLLGSMSRGEACPFSDLDFAIILEDEVSEDAHARQYFSLLANLLEIQFINLGEDNRIIKNIDPGLKFDDGHNTPTGGEFLGTISEYRQSINFVTDTHNTIKHNILIESKHLYGDESIFEAYQALIKEKLNLDFCRQSLAIRLLADHVAFYKEVISRMDTADRVDAKQDIFRFPALLVQKLCLYNDALISGTTIEKIDYLSEQRFLSQEFSAILKELVYLAMRLRYSAHMHYGCERDEIFLDGQTTKARYVMLNEHLEWWNSLRRYIIPIILEASEQFVSKPYNVEIFKRGANNIDKSFMVKYWIERSETKLNLARNYFNGIKSSLEDGNAPMIQHYIERSETHADNTLALDFLREGNWCFEQAANTSFIHTQVEFEETILAEYLEDENLLTTGMQTKIRDPYLIEYSEAHREKFGKRKVRSIRNAIHLKEYPELASDEFAATFLVHQTVGYLASFNTLKRFYVDAKCIPVLISKTVIGNNLHQYMALKNDGSPETPSLYNEDILNEIDEENYSLNFIKTLLLNPTDERAVNFIVYETKDQNSVVKKKLISIDNDHSFSSPREQELMSTVLRIQSIIYSCKEQMLKPIHQKVLRKIINLNPEDIIRTWLTSIQMRDEEYRSLFNTDELCSDGVDAYTIPIVLDENLAKTLYFKLTHLRSFLSLPSNAKATHVEILKAIEPMIAKDYERSFVYNLSPSARLEKVCTKQSTARGSLASNVHLASAMKKVPTKKEIQERKNCTPSQLIDQMNKAIPQGWNTLCTQIRSDLLNGHKAGYKNLPSDTLREEVISGPISYTGAFLPGLIFSEMTERQQKFILNILQEKIGGIFGRAQGLSRLNLNGCGSLTDDLLIKVIQSLPNLSWIDVRNCRNLTRLSLNFIKDSKLKTFYHPIQQESNVFDSLAFMFRLITGEIDSIESVLDMVKNGASEMRNIAIKLLGSLIKDDKIPENKLLIAWRALAAGLSSEDIETEKTTHIVISALILENKVPQLSKKDVIPVLITSCNHQDIEVRELALRAGARLLCDLEGEIEISPRNIAINQSLKGLSYTIIEHKDELREALVALLLPALSMLTKLGFSLENVFPTDKQELVISSALLVLNQDDIDIKGYAVQELARLLLLGCTPSSLQATELLLEMIPLLVSENPNHVRAAAFVLISIPQNPRHFALSSIIQIFVLARVLSGMEESLEKWELMLSTEIEISDEAKNIIYNKLLEEDCTEQIMRLISQLAKNNNVTDEEVSKILYRVINIASNSQNANIVTHARLTIIELCINGKILDDHKNEALNLLLSAITQADEQTRALIAMRNLIKLDSLSSDEIKLILDSMLNVINDATGKAQTEMWNIIGYIFRSKQIVKDQVLKINELLISLLCKDSTEHSMQNAIINLTGSAMSRLDKMLYISLIGEIIKSDAIENLDGIRQLLLEKISDQAPAEDNILHFILFSDLISDDYKYLSKTESDIIIRSLINKILDGTVESDMRSLCLHIIGQIAEAKILPSNQVSVMSDFLTSNIQKEDLTKNQKAQFIILLSKIELINSKTQDDDRVEVILDLLLQNEMDASNDILISLSNIMDMQYHLSDKIVESLYLFIVNKLAETDSVTNCLFCLYKFLQHNKINQEKIEEIFDVSVKFIDNEGPTNRQNAIWIMGLLLTNNQIPEPKMQKALDFFIERTRDNSLKVRQDALWGIGKLIAKGIGMERSIDLLELITTTYNSNDIKCSNDEEKLDIINTVQNAIVTLTSYLNVEESIDSDIDQEFKVVEKIIRSYSYDKIESHEQSLLQSSNNFVGFIGNMNNRKFKCTHHYETMSDGNCGFSGILSGEYLENETLLTRDGVINLLKSYINDATIAGLIALDIESRYQEWIASGLGEKPFGLPETLSQLMYDSRNADIMSDSTDSQKQSYTSRMLSFQNQDILAEYLDVYLSDTDVWPYLHGCLLAFAKIVGIRIHPWITQDGALQYHDLEQDWEYNNEVHVVLNKSRNHFTKVDMEFLECTESKVQEISEKDIQHNAVEEPDDLRVMYINNIIYDETNILMRELFLNKAAEIADVKGVDCLINLGKDPDVARGIIIAAREYGITQVLNILLSDIKQSGLSTATMLSTHVTNANFNTDSIKRNIEKSDNNTNSWVKRNEESNRNNCISW